MDLIADIISSFEDACRKCPLLDWPSWSMLGVLLGFLLYLALAEFLLPGKLVPGALLEDRTRKNYKCNGLVSLLLLLMIFGVSVMAGFLKLSVIAERGGELFSTTLAFCFLVSLLIYIMGLISTSTTASLKSRATGNPLNDWWLGAQLNPEIFGIDLKFFWIKAGMMGWFMLNVSIGAKQLQEDQTLSQSMALYQFFSLVYILDYFWHEEYMTSTWDIIAENFGFMLIFGDLVWIPFTFSIQGWWLLKHQAQPTVPASILNVLVFLIGYAVFRGANKQKHVFKKNNKALIWGEPPKVIGGKLLASGYWGVARHCNYLGDILLAFSFSLPCGISSPIPYFYPIYLFLLLLWRERRDESRCREKYREDWADYCKAVPWRIFPYLY